MSGALSHEPQGYECPFCTIVRGEDLPPPWTVQTDVVWRDDETTAWVNPRWWQDNSGSVVVVPNLHVENLYGLERELGGAVHDTARRLALAMKAAYACDGISTRQHNEPGGDQEVWHYHLHVFPRWTGDALYGSTCRLTTAEERSPYGDMLRAALRGERSAGDGQAPSDTAGLGVSEGQSLRRE